MSDSRLNRILRSAGVPDLVDVLADRLGPTDLQSLLLEVYQRLAANITPARLLEQYETNRFVAPSPVDPRKLLEFETLAWALLPRPYVAVELSPVCPLGTNSAVASVDQKKVLSTIRNTEVVADTTNVLALEAAVRRRKLRGTNGRRTEPVLLAASHRVMRAQVFQGPRSFAHFRILALCAAGRDAGSFDFECARLLEQLAYYLQFLTEVGVRNGSPFTSFRVAMTELGNGSRVQALQDRVLTPLSNRFPAAVCGMDPARTSGRGYYRDVCFKVHVTEHDGTEVEVGDGGMTDWTQKLMSDHKERFLISGLGVERLCLAAGGS
jgi:hypothetical protein